jgi:hypothetical protein
LTLVILVVILVVAWLVILGPTVLRRRSDHGDGVHSISHFHRQLSVLEHSGTKPIVLPAYRLHSSDGDATGTGARYPDVASVPVLTVVGADRLPRPALAFLGDDPTPGPGHSREEWPVDQSDPLATYRPVDPELRSLARRRRRDTLMVLLLTTVLTCLVGFIPGAGVAWFISLISGLSLVAYVAMLVHMRSLAQERERKLHYLQPPATVDRRGADLDGYGGLPGHPEVASEEDLAAYEASRYAHPARQAAVN